jgi:hypothetical protein
MSKLPIHKRFPGSHSTLRLKLWRPTASLEAEGPYDEVPSDLLCMIAAHPQPKGKALKAMKECLEKLKGQ